MTSIKTSLGNECLSVDAFKSLESDIKQRLPQIKKALKELRKRNKKLKKKEKNDIRESSSVAATMSEIAEAVGGVGNEGILFHDIGLLMKKATPTFFWAEEDRAKYLSTYSAFAMRLAAEETSSANMIRTMIVGSDAKEEAE